MPNDTVAHDTGRTAIRAVRAALHMLENPLADFLRPFDLAERRSEAMEVDLPLLDVAPFGAVTLPAATGGEDSPRQHAIRPRGRPPLTLLHGAQAISPPEVRPGSHAPGRSTFPHDTAAAVHGVPQPEAPIFTVRPDRRGDASSARGSTADGAQPPARRERQQAAGALHSATGAADHPSLQQTVSTPTVGYVANTGSAAVVPQPATFAPQLEADADPLAHAEVVAREQAALPALSPALARIDALANALLAPAVRTPTPAGNIPAAQPRPAIEPGEGSIVSARQSPIQPQLGETGRRSAPFAPPPHTVSEPRRPQAEPSALPAADAHALADMLNAILVEDATRHGVDLS